MTHNKVKADAAFQTVLKIFCLLYALLTYSILSIKCNIYHISSLEFQGLDLVQLYLHLNLIGETYTPKNVYSKMPYSFRNTVLREKKLTLSDKNLEIHTFIKKVTSRTFTISVKQV